MPDLEQRRATARDLILLAHASESEVERDAYYGMAQAWLAGLERDAAPAAVPALQLAAD